jgi:hypothetical protein
MIVGIALIAIVVVFVALDRGETKISFIVFTSTTALSMALAFAAGVGAVGGFLLGRRHYRS